MKLNHKQSLALMSFFVRRFGSYIMVYHSVDIGELFDEEATELRIIDEFGMAGKLWNNNGRIYVSGWSKGEIGEEAYLKQQNEIDEINEDIQKIIDVWG